MPLGISGGQGRPGATTRQEHNARQKPTAPVLAGGGLSSRARHRPVIPMRNQHQKNAVHSAEAVLRPGGPNGAASPSRSVRAAHQSGLMNRNSPRSASGRQSVAGPCVRLAHIGGDLIGRRGRSYCVAATELVTHGCGTRLARSTGESKTAKPQGLGRTGPAGLDSSSGGECAGSGRADG